MYLHLEIQEFKIEYKLLLLCIIFCNEKNDNKAQHIFLVWRKIEKSSKESENKQRIERRLREKNRTKEEGVTYAQHQASP